MYERIITLILFVASYLLFIILPNKRTPVALIGAALLVLSGAISVKSAFLAINWNVMGIFVGTLVVADIFMESRVPAYLAELIVDKAKNTAWAILAICALTGFISAFVENVATVLIVAPIAFAISKKLQLNPVKMMIAIAVSSNLQGAATLIGDPPSMLLAGYYKMNFMDFFFFDGKPSIFYAVEFGAFVSFVVLYFIFRRQRKRVKLEKTEKIKSLFPTFLLIVLIHALALSSIYDVGFSYMAGIICMIAALVSVVWDKFFNKTSILKGIRKLDWETTFFLMGVFVLVGSVTINGWIDDISGVLSGLVGENIFLGYTILVFFSVFLSAFVDNVPYLAAMLPVAISMSARLNINPALLLFGLLIGASIGGNITPIGASANIVTCGLLKKKGYHVSFREFASIGLPFTLAAVTAAYLLVWFIWS